jgi:hypothetical protein
VTLQHLRAGDEFAGNELSEVGVLGVEKRRESIEVGEGLL